MSSNPVSFRLPPNLEGKAEPEVVEAISYHDDAITDLQQAIPSLKSQIDAITATAKETASTVENISSSAETVITETSTIGMVNNQAGNTSYSTQPADYGAFILFSDASAIAVTLTTGTTIQLPWYAVLINQGAGLITATPATGTISYPNNLGAASMPIPQYVGAVIVYDGTNFSAVLFPVPPLNTPSVAHEWLNAYNATTGAFGQSQPAFSDLSGQINTSQLPSAGASGNIALAMLTPTGTEGSITVTNGIITAFTNPT